MKKILVISLAFLFLMQSCFSTRYVSNENALRTEFANARVSDVKFKMGEPDTVEETSDGYVYVYYYDFNNRRTGTTKQYTRFSFDSANNVRNIQSNRTNVRRKAFSPGKTVGLSLGVIGIIVIASLAAASE